MVVCSLVLTLAHAVSTGGPAAAAAPSRPARPRVPTEAEAVARADQAIKAHRAAVRAATGDGYTMSKAIVDPDGRTHVRYNRSYNGLPVVGGDFIVHNHPGGRFDQVTMGLRKPLTIATTPTVPSRRAASTARTSFHGKVGSVGTPRLVVDALSGEGRLAWETVVAGTVPDGQTPSRLHVLVDARTGTVMHTFDEVRSVGSTRWRPATNRPAKAGLAKAAASAAASTDIEPNGHGFYSGRVSLNTSQLQGNFRLVDLQHGSSFTCDLYDQPGGVCYLFEKSADSWGDGTLANRETEAVDAHYASAMTHDYFHNAQGRNSLFHSGDTVIMRVHAGSSDPDDLGFGYWDPDQKTATLGEGWDGNHPFTEIDLVASLLARGVVYDTLGLVAQGEAEGLDVATGDIFGEMAQFYANNIPEQRGDYKWGARILEGLDPLRPNAAARYMYDPPLDQFSVGCWFAGVDGERSIGIADHFFFMLAEGSGQTEYGVSRTCGSAPAVSGIGRESAAKIWYRALTDYFTPTTRYVDPFGTRDSADSARFYTLLAARDLYGYCSTQYQAVQAAWRAVSVDGLDPDCAAQGAADLNAMWNAYGDAGGHWTGGDGTVSVRLPDGRTVWLFSDTFLGAVAANHSRPPGTPLIRNSMVVQQGSTLQETRHGGTSADPSDLVVGPSGSGEWYWVADGIVDSVGGFLDVLYNRYASTGTGQWDFRLVGTSLATFYLPSLALMEVSDVPVGSTTAWGSAIMSDGDYTYIYGSEATDGGAFKFARVARVPLFDLNEEWEFWGSDGWTSQESAGVRLLSGVGTGFAVEKVGRQYVLITQDTNIGFSPSFVAHVADSPTGPFGESIYLFDGAAGYPDKPIFYYDAHVHRELSPPGRLVVSYNVNSTERLDNYADARIYRPRFVDVPLPLPSPGACGTGGPAAAGAAGSTKPRSSTKAVSVGPMSTAPMTLTATGSDDGLVRLDWIPPAVEDPPLGDLRYRIYQKDLTGGQTHFAKLPRADQTATSTQIPFLRDDHDYQFRVTAVDGGCESVPSNIAELVVNFVPPPTPTNLRAVPGTDGSIRLDWDPVQAATVFYAVYQRDVTPGSEEAEFRPVEFAQPVNNYLTVRNLLHEHTYEFKVTAHHGGGESGPSNLVRATAHWNPPGAPTGLTATPHSDGTIALAWTPPAANEPLWYWLYSRDVTDNPNGEFVKSIYPIVDGPSHVVSLLRHGRTYEFKVSAIGQGGEGAASNVARATAFADRPAAPTNLRATAGDARVSLAWDAPGPNLYYWVYYRNVSKGEAQFTKSVYPTDATTLELLPLSNGDDYELKVTAESGGGEGPPSNLVRAKPLPPLPAKVTGLTASAQPDGKIRLSWTGLGSVYYWIWQRDVTADPNAPFVKLQYPTDQTSFTAGVLTHNHLYEFKVAAENLAGVGQQSDPAQARAVYQPPAAPTNLRGTSAGDGSIALTWDAPGADLYYWVYSRDVTANPNAPFAKSVYPTMATTATLGLLRNGHAYQFKVTAENPGGEGPASTTIQVTAYGGLPAAPSGLAAAAGDGQVRLTWQPSPTGGVLYWVYYRDVTQGQSFQRGQLPVNGTVFTLTPLSNGDTYEFKVTAENASGESAPSNLVQARPLPPLPQAPSGLTATAGDGRVTLRWTASPSPNVLYWIYYRDVTVGQPFQRGAYPTADTIQVMSYLANGHTYEFKVTAANLAGESGATNTASARPMPPLPQAPSGLTATGGNGKVSLTWQPSPTPSVYYYVYLRDVTAGETWRRLQYPTLATSLEVYPLANGHYHEFKVTAINLSGESAPAGPVGAWAQAPRPPAPSNLRVEFIGGEARLSWYPGAGFSGWYQMYGRDRTAGRPFAFVGLSAGTSGTVRDIAGQAFVNHQYEFYVVALQNGVLSLPSNIAQDTWNSPGSERQVEAPPAAGYGIARFWYGNWCGMADAGQVSAHISGDWSGNFHVDYVDFTNDSPFQGAVSYAEFQDGPGTFARLSTPISLDPHSTRRVYLYMFPQRRSRVFTLNYVHERYFSECGNYLPGGGGLSTPAFQIRDL